MLLLLLINADTHLHVKNVIVAIAVALNKSKEASCTGPYLYNCRNRLEASASNAIVMLIFPS